MSNPTGAAPQVDMAGMFDREIVRHEWAHCPPQGPPTVPTVVFVVDEPGAGADRNVGAISQQLSRRGGAAEIVTEDLRAYYVNAVKAAGHTIDQEANKNADLWAQHWSEKADQWATAHRVDAVVKVPANDPAEFMRRTQTYRDAGYWVEAHLPALSEPHRRTNELHHHWERVSRGEWDSKLRPAEAYKDPHDGLRQIAHAVDRGGVVHAVHVPDQHGNRHHNISAHLRSGIDASGRPHVTVVPEPGWRLRPEALSRIDDQNRRNLPLADKASIEGQLNVISQRAEMYAGQPAMHGPITKEIDAIRDGMHQRPGTQHHQGSAQTPPQPQHPFHQRQNAAQQAAHAAHAAQAARGAQGRGG